MIYKKDKIRDWVFWVDWIMLAFIIFLFIGTIPTLQVDNWGIDSWYMHKLLFIMLGYIVIRLYINQSRMFEILKVGNKQNGN